MLNNVILFVILTWFIAIPLVFDVTAWLKRKTVPAFFRYSTSCKCCVIGYALVSITMKINIGYDEVLQNSTALRIYTITIIAIQLCWELFKYIRINKFNSRCENKNALVLSAVIAKYFDDTRGYNIFKREFSDISKEIWISLISNVDIRKIDSNIRNQLDKYLQDAERKAINTKDSKLLCKVIKTKLNYFNHNNSVTEYYKGIVYGYPEIEEQKTIKEIINSNPRSFKFIKEK